MEYIYRRAVKALQILCFLFKIFMYNILIFVLVKHHSGYHTTIKSPDKQNRIWSEFTEISITDESVE